MERRARRTSTPCSRRPCRSSRRRSRRWSTTTTRSSPSTACCCATRAASTCSTAARSSLPCQRAGELPVGLMVWSGAGHDDTVLAAGLAIEAALAGRRRGRAAEMRDRRHRRRRDRRDDGLRARRRRPRGHGLRAPRHGRRGCSFANAGLVAPGYVAPWAAPGMPAQGRCAISSPRTRRCGSPGALDAATLGWAWRWWRACRPQVYRANRARMHRLAHFSRERLLQLAHAAAPRLRARAGLPRPAAQRRASWRSPRPACARLPSSAPRRRSSTPPAAARSSPGLNPATPLHAGIYSKDDEVGNCREFTHLLRKEAERAGARFRFNAHVEQIVPASEPTLRVLQAPHDARDEALRSRDSERVADDAAAGRRDDRAELRRGRRLRGASTRAACCGRSACACRCIAVHGYSVTAPLRHDDAAPPPRAARGADGRALQGRDQPPRPARPRRRQRRDRRRRRAPERAGAGDARQGARRLVPGRDAAQRGAALERRAADAARRAAGARAERRRRASGSTSATAAAAGRSPRLGAPRRRRDRSAARRRSRSTASASRGCVAMSRDRCPRRVRGASAIADDDAIGRIERRRSRCSVSQRRAGSKARRSRRCRRSR